MSSIYTAVDSKNIPADMQAKIGKLEWMRPTSICLRNDLIGFFDLQAEKGLTNDQFEGLELKDL